MKPKWQENCTSQHRNTFTEAIQEDICYAQNLYSFMNTYVRMHILFFDVFFMYMYYCYEYSLFVYMGM
jgi:hypothetical protein